MCGLIMSANEPILRLKTNPFIHLGLFEAKSLLIGIDQNFFFVLLDRLGKELFLENGDKIQETHFSLGPLL